MMERWKDIPGYEGLSQVSDQGRVRNAKRMLKPTQITQMAYSKLLKETIIKEVSQVF